MAIERPPALPAAIAVAVELWSVTRPATSARTSPRSSPAGSAAFLCSLTTGARRHRHAAAVDTPVAPAPFEERRRRRRREGQLVEEPLVLLVRCLYVGAGMGEKPLSRGGSLDGAGDVAAPAPGQGRGHGPGDGEGSILSTAAVGRHGWRARMCLPGSAPCRCTGAGDVALALSFMVN